MTTKTDHPALSEEILAKWQRIVNLLASILSASAGLITQRYPSYTVVLVGSENKSNPYQKGALYDQDIDRYCDAVAAQRKPLLVANARLDSPRDRIPHSVPAIISYFGLPLQWPDGECFGTLCMLDSKENHFSLEHQQLMLEFKSVLEEDLRRITWASKMAASNPLRSHVTDPEQIAKTETEKALRASEATARTLLNTPTILTFLIDHEGIILDANKTMATRFGKSREELIGLCIWDLLPPKVRDTRKAHLTKTLTTGEIQHWEDYRAGAWFATTAEPIFDERGAVSKAVIVAYDVTERVHAQESLVKSEQKYRDLVNEAATIILRWDTDGNVTFLNEYAQRFFGFREKDIIGKNVVGTIVPETEFTGRNLSHLMEEIRRDPAAFENNENENIKSNGERVWIAWKNKPVFNQNGQLMGIHSIGIDITARKRAEDALRESEVLWRSLTENSPDHILILDEKLNIQFVNFPSPGLSKEELIGTPLYKYVADESQENVRSILKEAMETGEPRRYETQYQAPDGDTIYYESLAAPRILSGKVIGLTINARNITERKQAEEALRRTRDQLETRVRKRTAELEQINAQLKDEITERQLAEQALEEERRLFVSGPTVVFKWRAAQGWPVEYVSPNVTSQFGYDCDDFTSGKVTFTDIIHPDDLLRFSETVQAQIRTGAQYFEQEYRIAHRNGEYHWSYDLTTVVRNYDGEITHYHGYVIDITDRKRMEAIELGRSEVLEFLAMGAPIEEILYKLVIDAEESNPHTLCSILLMDYDRQHLRLGAAPSLPAFYNQAIDGMEIGADAGSCGTAAFTGKLVIVEDVRTNPLWKNFRDLAEQARLRACWSEPIISSHGQVLGTFAIYYREPRMPEANDLEFIKYSARLAGLAIERRLSEEQATLHQAELAHMARLNVMGEMATGIAHELNQPLTAIANFASAARKMVGSDNIQSDKIVSVLNSVQTQAQRASEIIVRLRKFVKKQSLQKSSVDLNMLVSDVIGFMETEAKNNNVQIKLLFEHELPIVFVDAIHIEQVLINLIRNALEAIVQAVSITRSIIIRTQVDDSGTPLVVIEDTGPGIDNNTLKQIFEPFVTTKGTKGMGMGLSISRSIIEAHGGRLWAESKPGAGSKFFLTVPIRAI